VTNVVLDYVDSLTLDASAAEQYANELRSLAYLSQGLVFLDGQVRRIEQVVTESLDPAKRFTILGNHPVLNQVPQGLVASAFHWYAVSACNYVQLTGWLAKSEDLKQANRYLKSVIPEVKIWRDKVGAHFARVDPRRDDSIADLLASVMFPIAFDDNAFWTGTFTLAVSRGGVGSSSRADMRWSLTDTHRKLTERYWPSAKTEANNKESEAVHA
jgi:hypothetical protein